MKVEIRTTYKNAILLRDEILADIFFEGKTPSRIQVHKEIAKKIGAPEDTVIVKSIQSLFGEQKAHAKIFKYDTKDALDKLEPAYLLKRQAKAEKPKTEEVKEEPEKAAEEPKKQAKEAVAEAKAED
ncbi:MAG: hypothetical protein ABIJ21_02540 [Nanoarchaeota archaeon]